MDIFWASFSLEIRARRGVGRDGESGETGSRARRGVGRDGESGETGIRHPQFFVNAYDTFSCKWEKQVEKIYRYVTTCVRGEGGGHFMIFFGGGGNDPLPHTNMGAFCSHNLSHFQQKSQFKDFLQTFNTFCGGGGPITPAPPPYKYWCILLTCFSHLQQKSQCQRLFANIHYFWGPGIL